MFDDGGHVLAAVAAAPAALNSSRAAAVTLIGTPSSPAASSARFRSLNW